jgi:hypothetical protein
VRNAIDCYFELALQHLVDFFCRMEVLVYRGAALKVIAGEGHRRRMKIPSAPAGQSFVTFREVTSTIGKAVLLGMRRIERMPWQLGHDLDMPALHSKS